MNNCLLCRDEIIHELTPQEIFTGMKIKQDFLCSRCEAEFHQIKAPHCPTCFRQQDKSKQCPDCKYWQALGYHNFKHQAIFSYNLAMHDYFKRYKRYGDYVLRLVFQPYLQQVLRQWQPPFIYVPTQTNHWQQRQFDPVKGIFGDLVKLTPALIKLPTSTPQAQKNRQQRLKTPQFFDFDQIYAAILQATQVTILDDIYTTGRTIFHARDCLRQQGYQGQISSLSLAR